MHHPLRYMRFDMEIDLYADNKLVYTQNIADESFC